jgi:hypothetical protein
MDYEYIGWVPCVSGRLFFEYTYPGLGDPKYSINHVELDISGAFYHRYVIASSIVNWKDEKENNTKGTYKVYMIGDKTSDEIDLVGTICIVPEDEELQIINEIEKNLKIINKKILEEEEIKNEYNKLKKIISKINEKRFYKVDYIVESPGFTKLKYDSPEKADLPESHKYTVTRQSYYYIKYTLHKHRHHHDKAESLTTIHPLSVDKERIGIKLLNDLRKSLVQLKRDFEPYNCNNIYHSSGVASYAKSLAESCYKNGYLNEKEYKSEKSYFDNIKDSLEVMSGVVEKDIAKRTMHSGNARAIILFALSIIMPVVLIFRDKIAHQTNDKENYIVEWISVVVSSDYKLLILAFLLFAFYWVYMFLKMNHGAMWLSFKYYRDFLEQIVYEKTKATIMLVVILIISIVLVFYSINSIFTG